MSIPQPRPPRKPTSPPQFLHDVQTSFDNDTTTASTQQDKLDLLESIQSFTFPFIKEANLEPRSEAQAGLDLLWHMFTSSAKVIDAEDAMQEKLLALLIWTRGLDGVYKGIHPGMRGREWEEYGFVEGLQKQWEEVVKEGKMEQLCNLASFSAKALAVGACGDRTAGTVLWFLREALETEDGERTRGLLPVAVRWFQGANYRVLGLCVGGWGSNSKVLDDEGKKEGEKETSQTNLHSPGPLALKAGTDQPGFSLQRWLFWRRRFQTLSHDADEKVVKEAKKGFMAMIPCGRLLDLEIEGEVRFGERLQKVMRDALIKSGKESLGVGEVGVECDWVD